MRAGQRLYDENGYQVALFPLEGFHISQTDMETFSHDPTRYYATDYMGWNANGRVYRDPCYAPVDIECVWVERTNCLAIWQSLREVHMYNRIAYLTLIVYHDQDITNGLIIILTY